ACARSGPPGPRRDLAHGTDLSHPVHGRSGRRRRHGVRLLPSTLSVAGASFPMDAVVDITGVAHGGDGVCRIDDRVCFVPYALPGDRLRIVVEREAKGVLWGVLADIVEPSPHRQDATGCCPVGRHCGACGWLHFAYPAQAEWKRRIVLDSLQRIARVEADVEWVEDPELRLGYRTRAEFHGDGS